MSTNPGGLNTSVGYQEVDQWSAPVCFLLPLWASAEAAKLLAVADAFLSDRIEAALEATLLDVFFEFLAIDICLW